jgi:hypothetical protein
MNDADVLQSSAQSRSTAMCFGAAWRSPIAKQCVMVDVHAAKHC